MLRGLADPALDNDAPRTVLIEVSKSVVEPDPVDRTVLLGLTCTDGGEPMTGERGDSAPI